MPARFAGLWRGARGTQDSMAASAASSRRVGVVRSAPPCTTRWPIAAMLVGGLHGIENELPLEEEMVGNAYESDAPHVPVTLQAARDLFSRSEIARAAFGDDVVDHYTNMADVELAAFDAAVTDWELRRGFERF